MLPDVFFCAHGLCFTTPQSCLRQASSPDKGSQGGLTYGFGEYCLTIRLERNPQDEEASFLLRELAKTQVTEIKNAADEVNKGTISGRKSGKKPERQGSEIFDKGVYYDINDRIKN